MQRSADKKFQRKPTRERWQETEVEMPGWTPYPQRLTSATTLSWWYLRMTMTEDWAREWERRIVNGVYPLRRFLGRSNHSVVFLTECKAQNLAEAAIKIVPANPALTDAQLEHWKT